MSESSFTVNHLQFKTSEGDKAQTKLIQEYQALSKACQEFEKSSQEIKLKLPRMASPAYRSNAQNRLRILDAQFSTKIKKKRALGLQLRMRLIRQSLTLYSEKKHTLSPEDFFESMCKDSLPPIQNALNDPPYGGKAWQPSLKHLEQGLESLYNVWKQGQIERLKAAFTPLKTVSLPEKANPQEKGLIKRYLLLVENALLQVLGSTSSKNIKKVSAALKPQVIKPQGLSSSAPQLKGMGKLQVSFDLNGGKTFVKDQLGTQVNAASQKTFDELLSEGMNATEKAFKRPPPKLPLIQSAVTSLSEAMSAESKRFEPYFSLGYIFANLEEWPKAIMLLETAYAISQRADIKDFLKEVQATASAGSVWQK